MVFIENEAALLCVTMWERARAFAAQSRMQLFDITFAMPLKLVFVVHFLNTFWHGNKTFPNGSS